MQTCIGLLLSYACAKRRQGHPFPSPFPMVPVSKTTCFFSLHPINTQAPCLRGTGFGVCFPISLLGGPADGPSLCCRPWRLSICLAVYWAKQTSRFTEKLANVEAISLFLSHLLPALSGRSDSSLLLSHPSLLPSQWGLRLLFSLLIPFSRVSSAQPMNAFYSCLC